MCFINDNEKMIPAFHIYFSHTIQECFIKAKVNYRRKHKQNHMKLIKKQKDKHEKKKGVFKSKWLTLFKSLKEYKPGKSQAT